MEANVVNRTMIRYVRAFASLDDDACDALLRGARERRLSANEILFRQGDAGDAMVIVHHGSLSVRVRRPDGYDAEVAVAQGGEVLGEMCVVDPAPRSATVVATAQTLVCELHRDAVARLRDEAPAAYAAVMGAVIRDLTRRFRDVDARVASLLAGAAPSAPPPREDSPEPAAPVGALRRLLDGLRRLS